MKFCTSKLKPSALPSLAFALIAAAAFVGDMVLLVAGNLNREFFLALLGAVTLGLSVFFCLMVLLWWPRGSAT
ncbi:MAG: hypothetical protein PSV26_03050 [Polaromonas sp.]|uniref:hypothetical protein n=1 Tax=Polaromonas sp. TaxID=1869339 RepID=UPI00248756D4|nr:hypothetical protein [Polaromonas sp.]MDI1236444.1 hypothetical protein [Polaromonas sp.]